MWLWVGLFAAISLFIAWMVFGSGAEMLEHPFFTMMHMPLGFLNPEMDEGEVRVYYAGIWILLAIWFVVGLIIPECRLGIGGE